MNEWQLKVLDRLDEVWPSESPDCQYPPFYGELSNRGLAEICGKSGLAGCYEYQVNTIWATPHTRGVFPHELIHWRQWCDARVMDLNHQAPGVWCHQEHCVLTKISTW